MIIMLDVFCFKHEIPLNQFFDIVVDLYSQADSRGIPIAELSTYIENQKNEILRLQSETEREVQRRGATMNLLKEYQENMPSFSAQLIH